YCSIQDAIDAVPNGGAGVLRVGGSNQSYAESLEIADGKTIAILAVDGERPTVVPNSDGPTLEVSGLSTTAYVEGLRFRANTYTHAITVSGATVVLDRVESVANIAGGLRVMNAATATVRNCIIGADANNVQMVRVDGATL